MVLIKEFLEAALEGEMTSHMPSCLEESDNQNRRNGKSSKTMQSPMGSFELETPRDRNTVSKPLKELNLKLGGHIILRA